MLRHFRRALVVSILYLIVVVIAIKIFHFGSLAPPHICQPTARSVTNSTIPFDQGTTVCAGLDSPLRGMLIYDDKLIVGDFTRDALIAFNLQSGTIRWQAEVQGNHELVLDKARQQLYTSATNGEIDAVNIASGEVVWRNYDEVGQHNGYAPLLLADGQLIGRNIFSAPPRPINADTGVLGAPIAAISTNIFPDGYAWIISNGYLTAINALSGEIVWQAAEPSRSSNYCLNDVAVNETTVLTKTCNRLTAYDYATRAVRWEQYIPHMAGYAALTDGSVYVVDAYPALHILRLSDGVSVGEIQFKPSTPSPDSSDYAGDQNNRNWVVASGKQVAVYFADQSTLSVYRFH